VSLRDVESTVTAQCADDKVRVLDPKTLKPTRVVPLSGLDSVALSPDGSLVLGVTGLDKIALLEAANGLPRMEIPFGKAAAFLPDGSAVVAAPVPDVNAMVTVYEIPSGKPRRRFEHPSKTGVSGVAVSPDGKRLATADTGPNGHVWVWDIKSGEPLADWPGTAPVAFAGNDRVANREPGKVTVRTAVDGKLVHAVPVDSSVFALTPDGKRLIAAGTGPRMGFWNLATGTEDLTPGDLVGEVRGFAADPASGSVFLGSGGHLLRWAAGDKAPASVAKPGGPVGAVGFAGGRLFAGTAARLEIWDAPKAGAAPARTVEVGGPVRAIGATRDGSRVAVGTETPEVVVLDPLAGKVLRSFASPSVAVAVAVDPAGSRVAAVCRDGFVRAWDLSTGRPGEAPDGWKARAARTPKAGIGFSPDGTRIVASSATRVTVYEAATGKPTDTFDRSWEDGPFQDVTFSPDGRCIATGSVGPAGAVVVWELPTRTVVRRFSGETGTVAGVRFLDGGRRVASLSADSTVLVWDVAGGTGTKPPAAADLSAAWEALDKLPAAAAEPAVWTLAAGGAAAVPVIRKGVANAGATDRDIAKQVAALDAADPKARAAASKALSAHGVRAVAALTRAAEEHDSPEVRLQAGKLLAKFDRLGVKVPENGLYGEPLRHLRAVTVLEQIGGDDARAVLGLIRATGGRPGGGRGARAAQEVRRAAGRQPAVKRAVKRAVGRQPAVEVAIPTTAG
jgi:WD40 repeat protein